MTHLDNDQVNEVKAVSGGSMLIRREVIEQIGVLDERFFAYQEDTDYCFQARKAGWKIYYVPQAGIIHYGGRGVREAIRILEFTNGIARIICIIGRIWRAIIPFGSIRSIILRWRVNLFST